MKSVVLSHSVALSLLGLLCCLCEANENFSPKVLVLLKEPENMFDNSVGSDINSVISPSDYYYSPSRHVQLWNKVYDNLQKRINVLGHFLWNVDKIPINSSPHIDRRFKKSIISIRKPRSTNDSSNSTSVTTIPITVTPINLNKSEEMLTSTVSTNFKLNINDLQEMTNSTNNSNFDHSTTSNPKLVETTTLLVQEKVQNNSTNVNIEIVKPSSDISSNPQSCSYCSGKLIFLTVVVILAFGVTFFTYKKWQNRGSRTLYQVGNICNKRDESPA